MSWPKAGAGTGKGLASAAGRCISVGICGAGFAAVRPGGGTSGATVLAGCFSAAAVFGLGS